MLIEDNIERFDNKGDYVYSQLANNLITGELLPNERLKIRELANTMGTSVTPVRDAVLRMVQEGVFVLHSPRDIRVIDLTLAEYLEIRSIRLELEGMAAGKAALLATSHDVAILEGILKENEQALANNDSKACIILNQKFHFEMCRIAQMPILMDVLKRLWIKIGPLIAQVYILGGREMIDHHYPILQAIQNKDPQAARISIQTDILSGGKVLLKHKMAK
ncbi:MAG: GntR family transcriptional regulator [Neisseriaceae bacterium]|nr:GntR family transcriptional regulator [Neisseriaceae bacterium]MBP6861244.1 GntR family transcriptional regulator [Neisseriaceae bacterium]